MFRTQNLTIAFIVLALILSGCGSPTPTEVARLPTETPLPPSVALVINPDIKDVLPGQTVALTVETSGQNLRFKWSASRGKLSAFDTPAVIYTAPDSTGVDTVTVEVSSSSGATIENVSFNIIAPTPTLTPSSTPTDVPTFTPTPELPIDTPVPPTDTPLPVTDTPIPSTDTPPSPPSLCPTADAEGTIAPAVAISSIMFVVNGVEQVVRDGDALQASSDDQVRVKEVTICPDQRFESSGGVVYIEFDPVETDPADPQKGKLIVDEVKGTRVVQVTSGLTTVPGPDYTWTIGDSWRHISVITVHYPPDGGTQNPDCEGGFCEIDDRMIVGIQ